MSMLKICALMIKIAITCWASLASYISRQIKATPGKKEGESICRKVPMRDRCV